ncbi:MAG: helix-turn-helix domain-containing protein [Lachnospiraceae bacterium]|nr:helix-turn-helix domain-containing protein [Lachnospiraceae bacterium]
MPTDRPDPDLSKSGRTTPASFGAAGGCLPNSFSGIHLTGSLLFSALFETLSKLIQENAGENFTTIMTRLRIQKAKDLLATTDYTVTRISELSGYSKPDYFAFVFKKETGMPPSYYRKKQSENQLTPNGSLSHTF